MLTAKKWHSITDIVYHAGIRAKSVEEGERRNDVVGMGSNNVPRVVLLIHVKPHHVMPRG